MHELIESFSGLMGDQKKMASLIGRNVVELSEVSHRSEQHAGKLKDVSTDLKAAAVRLEQGVTKFRLSA
jgi:hypothetical protein